MADRVKKRTIRKKKTKGFKGKPKWAKTEEGSLNSQQYDHYENIRLNNDPSSVQEETVPPVTAPTGASAGTISQKKVEEMKPVTPKKYRSITGYRIIDMEILSQLIATLICPICFEHTLILSKDPAKKKRIMHCVDSKMQS